MTLPIQGDLPPLCQTEDGVVRVSGTRVPLERVVRAFRAGATPEQIAQDFDTLKIESVYAVVNYYLHHRRDVEEYLAMAEQEAQKTRRAVEQDHDPTGIRARLMARRPAESG